MPRLTGAKGLALGVLGGGKKPFSPSDISGLRLWLEADYGLYQDAAGTTPATADGHPVGLWKDRSGNGYDVSQSTDGKRPVLKLGANGIYNRPALSFTAASTQYLIRAVANWLSDTAGSIFMVIKPGTLTDTQFAVIASGDETNGGSYFEVRGYRSAAQPNAQVVALIGGNLVSARGSTTIATATTYIQVLRSNDTAWTIRVNGADETLTTIIGTPAGQWFGDVANRDNFTIGGLRRDNEDQKYDGLIAAVLVFGSNLIGTDLTNMETYLNTRYAAYPF